MLYLELFAPSQYPAKVYATTFRYDMATYNILIPRDQTQRAISEESDDISSASTHTLANSMSSTPRSSAHRPQSRASSVRSSSVVPNAPTQASVPSMQLSGVSVKPPRSSPALAVSRKHAQPKQRGKTPNFRLGIRNSWSCR